MITTVVLVILLVLSCWYIVHLHYTYRKHEQERDEVIRRVLDGNLNSRLLSSEKSQFTQNDFLINQLIEDYQSHIIQMNHNEMKRKEFLANISHDIRTPLTSIIGYLDAIRNSIIKTEEEKERYLEIASNRSRQLKIILDDIFELAKADSNELPLNKKVLSIHSILTDTLIEFIPIFEEENLQLINHISADDTLIYADEYSIKRILENLVYNAISHGKDGGIIGIDATTIGNEYCVEIWDEGVGIEDDIDKIFLRLYKKNNTGSNNGLGLAIAKTLVEKNEGRITVTSTPNEKTSFSVAFPIVK